MKKIIIPGLSVILIIVIVLLVLSISSPQESSYRLQVEVDYWTDQDIDYPEDIFYFDTIKLHKTYTIPLEGEAGHRLRKFKVVRIRENSITIRTSVHLSDGEGGINFFSSKRKFSIEADKTLHLYTLTMDGGEIYRFSLVNKE